MKNTHTIEIDAPRERVFEWLNDGSRAKEWVPNLVETEALTATEHKVGSTFRHVYVENGRRMEMRGEVVGFEPNRRLTVSMTGEQFDLHVDYLLDDLGDHRTQLTQHSEVRFKSRVAALMGALMRPLMRRMSRKQAEKSFGALKQLIEASLISSA